MGLFGSLLGIGSSLLGLGGSKGSKNDVSRAAQIQAQAAQQGIAEQRRQFDLSRGDQMPWLEAGQEALGAQGDLLGLNGASKQALAIGSLKDSPLFQSIYDTGEEAILQNASATGGLRGGRTIDDLARFGTDTLSRVIQQQLGNLGGISSQGGAIGQGLGALGANAAGNIGNLLGQSGAAQAGGILGARGIQNAQNNSLMSSLAGLGTDLGLDSQISKFFKGLF